MDNVQSLYVCQQDQVQMAPMQLCSRVFLEVTTSKLHL